MRGERQWTHSRHCGEKSVTTWSPGASDATPSPTRSTTPAPSCPSTVGAVAGRVGAGRGVEIGVADAARDEPDEHLARLGLGELDLLHLERRAELLQHGGADLHRAARSVASKPRVAVRLVAERLRRRAAAAAERDRLPRRQLVRVPVRVDQLERARDPVGPVLAHRDRDRGHDFDSTLGRVKICLVTPFAWSLPHDVNQHVAGIAKELRALGHSVTVLAPSGRPADLAAGRRALARGEARGDDRDRDRGAGVAPLEPRRPGRRPREPPARAAAGRLRRRPRLRARPAQHLVPRAARLGGARRRELLLARPARLPAAAGAAREAARTHRRADRVVRCDRSRSGRALPRRLPSRFARRRHRALPARARSGNSSRSSSTVPRAVAPARRPRSAALASGAARLGGGAAADEAALDAAGDPARAPRPRARPLREDGRGARGRARRSRRRRPRPGGLRAAAPRGRRRRRGARCPAGRARAARARRGGAPTPRRERRGARAERTGSARGGRVAELRHGRTRARAGLQRPRRAQARPPPRRRSAGRPAVDPRRPAHAHAPGRTTARSRSTSCSTTPRRRSSARSRSPTTTSSAARSRRSRRRAAAS